VRPQELKLPPLRIAINVSDDPCRQRWIEGSSQEFVIANLNVISDRHGLVYSWSVTWSVATATNAATLSIPVLPAAGTKVTVQVTVTNAHKIHARMVAGLRNENFFVFTFQETPQPSKFVCGSRDSRKSRLKTLPSRSHDGFGMIDSFRFAH
jgi:hypothetical protein